MAALVAVTSTYSTEAVNGHLLAAYSSVQCLRWNGIPDWVLRSFFKEAVVVVVVVVIQGRGRRNQRHRDALRARIRTDASLMWSSRETEDVCGARPALSSSPQRLLSTPRARLHLFIAQRAHTKHTYNIRFHLCRRRRQCRPKVGWSRVYVSYHMCKCESGEIKRKSMPVDVRTGRFQRRVPRHQLAGCAVSGSC